MQGLLGSSTVPPGPVASDQGWQWWWQTCVPHTLLWGPAAGTCVVVGLTAGIHIVVGPGLTARVGANCGHNCSCGGPGCQCALCGCRVSPRVRAWYWRPVMEVRPEVYTVGGTSSKCAHSNEFTCRDLGWCHAHS